jgi:glycosyltransferase involved in cell wall biosynthesis
VRALSLENNVIFIVNVSASSYYQLFDCFVQSSRTEGISLALLEAMSIGLPCVVTETSNHPVITHNYDGFIVDANDISMLAETITRCFDEKETTQNFGGNAKNTVMKRFENGSMIARYKRLFENLHKK